MASSIAQVRQTPPAAPPPDALAELRALAGNDNAAADELVQAVRRAMKREYERGYVEGRAGRRPPAPKGRSRYERWKRDARHAGRDWMTRTRQLRKTLLNLVLVVVMTAAGIVISLRVSSSTGDKKFAIPTVTK